MGWFSKRAGRFLAAAIVLAACTTAACAPVMTTRYRVIPETDLRQGGEERYRFELADGATVDMRVTGINDDAVSGQRLAGGPALVDLRQVRRVGVGFDERDEAATSIKRLFAGSAGYAGFLLAIGLLAVAGH